MERVDIKEAIRQTADSQKSAALMSLPMVEWRKRLAKECQVYVFEDAYLAKRFDQINYKFCTQDTAKQVLVDNLYALLRYKYFPRQTDEIDKLIDSIVKSCVANIKSTLVKVTFNNDEDCKLVRWLPNGCIAFRNGIFDFAKNDWLFKYDVIKIDGLSNTIYNYDPSYIITWYININFEPYPVGVMDIDLNDFINMFREQSKEVKNYCFELMYNMSHDSSHKFSRIRFKHLCEILGYLCYQPFTQKFVMLIGSGQNGKNSLFDGCFINRVIPKPAAVDLKFIEENNFVTGALENHTHNIYLETPTDDETYDDNTNLKALTGSQFQSIIHKGQDPYSGIINCRYIWSANDQEHVKFKDSTPGFRRRINIFEIYYKYDSDKRFLKMGDYYDTTYSEDLHEITEDTANLILFIYFAMFGIKSATNGFTTTFNFTENDWRLQYTDVDLSLRDAVSTISAKDIVRTLRNPLVGNYISTGFYDSHHRKILESNSMVEYIRKPTKEGLINFFDTEEDYMAYFTDYWVYMSTDMIKAIIENKESTGRFNNALKKAFGLPNLTVISQRNYVKVTFVSGKLKILGN